MNKKMYIEVDAPSDDKCSDCPFFVLDHLDYFCDKFNRYIHGYNRLPECKDTYGY